MAPGIIISTKVLGRRKPLLADWSIDFPPHFSDDGGHLTLRELITRVVIEQVKQFRKRQADGRFVHVLSAKQINDAAERGKINSGGRNLKQKVDEEYSVAAALQAFEDGLYLVVIDEQKQDDLDKEVFLKPDSKVTFLRLVMLAGG